MNRAAIVAMAVFAVQATAQDHYAALPEDREMKAFVTKVLAMTGLHNDVRVVRDPETTACGYAATVGDNQYIGLAPGCVGRLRYGLGYNWHAVGVVGHEVGHLLGGHTTNAANSHQEESEADEWSGWMMHRLGSTLPEAQTFVANMNIEATSTHPARWARLAAVERGWNTARRETLSWRLQGTGSWAEIISKQSHGVFPLGKWQSTEDLLRELPARLNSMARAMESREPVGGQGQK